MATENDIVLVYYENQPVLFARIEEITPDRKKNWYHVRLLLLNLPLQTVTWILKDVYIDGQEFTMDGKRMKFEKVIAPKQDASRSMEETETEASHQSDASSGGKIIPLADRKPKA